MSEGEGEGKRACRLTRVIGQGWAELACCVLLWMDGGQDGREEDRDRGEIIVCVDESGIRGRIEMRLDGMNRRVNERVTASSSRVGSRE